MSVRQAQWIAVILLCLLFVVFAVSINQIGDYKGEIRDLKNRNRHLAADRIKQDQVIKGQLKAIELQRVFFKARVDELSDELSCEQHPNRWKGAQSSIFVSWKKGHKYTTRELTHVC